MRAPHGDLSIIPVHVSGLSQSSTPLDITTAFFDAAPLPALAGPRNTMMSQPCGPNNAESFGRSQPTSH